MARYQRVQMPERPRGTPEEALERLYRYLYQMAETINHVIDKLDREAADDGETGRT